jgi:hypothetical protein
MDSTLYCVVPRQKHLLLASLTSPSLSASTLSSDVSSRAQAGFYTFDAEPETLRCLDMKVGESCGEEAAGGGLH